MAETTEDILVRLLGTAAGGLDTGELVKRLRAAGRGEDADTVARTLGRLSARGTVRLGPGRRWQLAAAPAAPAAPPDRAPAAAAPRRSGRKPAGNGRAAPAPPPAPAARRAAAVRGPDAAPEAPSDATLWAVAAEVRPAPPPPAPPAGIRNEPGLAHLRRLLPYYAACLAADERHGRLLCGLERAGEQHLLVRPAARWWPAADAGTELRIPVDRLPDAFLTALNRRRGEPVALGYPVAFQTQRDGPGFLVPVGVVTGPWRLTDRTLVVALPPQAVQVNVEWARRHRELDWLLGDDAEDDAAIGPGVPAPEAGRLDMAALADRLETALRPEVRTPLTPAAPDVALDPAGRPGLYNAVLLLLPEAGPYSRGARQELDALARWTDAELAGTALAAVADPDATAPPDDPPPPALEPLALGEDQLAAVRDGLAHRVTVVTGPPGTGKSQAVTALMASAALAGRSVLLASRNHKALDAVEQRLAALAGDRVLLTRASFPYGSGARFDFVKAVDALISRPGAAAGDLDRRTAELAALDAERRADLAAHAAVQDLGDRLGAVEQALAAQAEVLGRRAVDGLDAGYVRVPPLPAGLAAPEPAPAGPLARLLAGWRRRRRLRRLRALGLDWAALGWPAPAPDTADRCAALAAAAAERARLAAERTALETELRAALAARPDPARVFALTGRIRDGAAAALPGLAAALETLTAEERRALTETRGALGLARHGGRGGAALEKALWQDHAPVILRHFPLWAVTTLSVHGRVPLMPGLFDYVVIDEASQCDIASALPLLARARRAVIVGDPAQLRHVTRLTEAWEVETLRRLGLFDRAIGRFAYSQNSLFTLCAATPGARRHLLRDHYRCHEDIAGYISAAFYGRQLRVLTPARGLRPPPGTRPGLHWTAVRGPVAAAKSGCHAPAELAAVTAHLHDLLVERGYRGSVGVVTPFAEQAARLTDAIHQRLPQTAIAGADLKAFTAHRFQGDDRDVILFSLCLGPDMPEGSRAYLASTGHLVNVAVSRARAVCHVFGDPDAALGSDIPHIAALARAALRPGAGRAAVEDGARAEAGRGAAPGTGVEDLAGPGTGADPGSGGRGPAGPFESPWEERLYHALRARGLDPIPQYPLAGRRLDLALIRGDRRLDVEVDGAAWHRDPDGHRRASDLWRDHQVTGLGWQVLRFWVYQLREDMDDCVDRIAAALHG